MATYTMQLRAYIEMFSQYEDNLTWNERIEIGRKKLFDFYYPIYDDDFRKVFETNIIKNFYMREIGFETEGLFKFRLETWLNINMPYFNKLFESELIKYDPLINASMMTARDKVNNKDQTNDRNILQTSKTDTQMTGDISQESENESQSVEDNFGRKVGSDNPDSRLQLQTEKGKGVIEYASKIDENKVDNKGNSSSKGNVTSTSSDTNQTESMADKKDKLQSNTDETEHFIERRLGKIGINSQADLIKDYRSALLRVEVQIHKEMQELFMLVY